MNRLKRLLKRKRKNSGFTLVEVVISCGLLGILVLGITVFIAPVLKSAASNEANVRATLLADTVNNYISRSTRSAYYVKIFKNATREEAMTGGAITTDEDLVKMKNFVDTSVDTKTKKKIFELKCISFSWVEDTRTQENKYMILNETFVDGSTAINSSGIRVFENCFYDGLFPEFQVEQLKETVTPPEGGTPTEKSVPALKITTNVYNNQKMDAPEFIGVGYTEYNAIKNKTINPNGIYVFFGDKEMRTPAEDDATRYTTFIYYVARRSTAA